MRNLSPLLLLFSICVSLTIAQLPFHAIQAQAGLPDVQYTASSNTIYIGRAYKSDLATESPYVGYPSHPNAPKLTIDVPQLAEKLKGLGQSNLLVAQSANIWLLKANVVVAQNSLFSITNANVNEFRMESILVNGVDKYATIIGEGGQVRIQGVRVHSWDTAAGKVDPSYEGGRSYLLILDGGRMDIIDSEISYLGWREANPNLPDGRGKGEPSGIAWKRRATDAKPETGPTGSIINSRVHHLYYGNYTWQATSMVFAGNRVYANAYYGFDPHDYSINFDVYNNEFFDNPSHGMIFSRGCTNNRIHHNKFYRNGLHGFMLDRGSDNNEVYANEMYENGADGLVVFQSVGNRVHDNNIHNNKSWGIRVNSRYDPNDIYDGLSTDNVFQNNIVYRNVEYGIGLYDRADRNIFRSNQVFENGIAGFYLKTGENQLFNNTTTNNLAEGILVVGSVYVPPDPGTVRPIDPVSKPGFANLLDNNFIYGNKQEGIKLSQGVQNVIGKTSGNKIYNNQFDGISLSDASTDNIVQQNGIYNNQGHGIETIGTTTQRNRFTQNSISGNVGFGIFNNQANGNLSPPVVAPPANNQVTGIAPANAKIELYQDTAEEGLYYIGAATANREGAWSYPLANQRFVAGSLTALAITNSGDTSGFSSPIAVAFKPIVSYLPLGARSRIAASASQTTEEVENEEMLAVSTVEAAPIPPRHSKSSEERFLDDVLAPEPPETGSTYLDRLRSMEQ